MNNHVSNLAETPVEHANFDQSDFGRINPKMKFYEYAVVYINEEKLVVYYLQKVWLKAFKTLIYPLKFVFSPVAKIFPHSYIGFRENMRLLWKEKESFTCEIETYHRQNPFYEKFKNIQKR